MGTSYVLEQNYGEWSFGLNYSRRGRIFRTAVDTAGTGLKNFTTARPFSLVDARIALSKIPLGKSDATAEVALVGNNILNEKYFYGGTDFGQFATMGLGLRRTIGIEAAVSF